MHRYMVVGWKLPTNNTDPKMNETGAFAVYKRCASKRISYSKALIPPSFIVPKGEAAHKLLVPCKPE